MCDKGVKDQAPNEGRRNIGYPHGLKRVIKLNFGRTKE
jgi:hypothetical protein